jgi:hypothetical protein
VRNRHKTACLNAAILVLTGISSNFYLPTGALLAQTAPDPEFDAGMISFKANDFKTAVAHFGKAIAGGNRSAAVYLFSGHCFLQMNETQRALKTYEIVTTSFKDSPEAKTAADVIKLVNARSANYAQTEKGAKTTTKSAAVPGAAGAPNVTPSAQPTLLSRSIVVAPLFNHPKVSQATIDAQQQAIAALPAALRKRLDDSDARIFLSPNVIDRWPETLKDLNEDGVEPTVCEAPGRIYGHEMMVYERPKQRHSNDLLAARAPSFIRLQVGNMCFQVLDEFMTISKSAALREQWELDKMHIPESVASTVARFTNPDDWGPKETCAELFGALIGGRDENTDNLYRYFPHTKRYLIAKLGLPNQ